MRTAISALAGCLLAAAILLLPGCGGEGCADDCAPDATQDAKTTLPPPCDERPEACR